MIRGLIILLVIANTAFAQKIDSIKVDSVKKVAVDSAKKVSFLKKFFPNDSVNKANPARKAFLRSLAVPGWGQATNKEYWLIPVVYGAAAGGVYAIWWNNNKYKFYLGYLRQIIIDKKPEVYITIKGETRGPYTQAQIEPAVNVYRRQRDLCYIVFALGWTLQAVQANVSAHLKTFDMSDDISLKFEPSIQSTSFGNAVGAKLVLNF